MVCEASDACIVSLLAHEDSQKELVVPWIDGVIVIYINAQVCDGVSLQHTSARAANRPSPSRPTTRVDSIHCARQTTSCWW